MTATMVKEMSPVELRELVEEADRTHVSRSFNPEDGGAFAYEGARLWRTALGEEFSVSEDAWFGAGKLLGVPVPFTKKIPPELLVPIYNHRLGSDDAPNSMGFMTMGEGQIESFNRGEHNPVLNTRILDVINEAIGSSWSPVHVSHTPHRTSFSVITEDEHEIRNPNEPADVGDFVRSGVSVVNSLSMEHSLEVSGYIHRLICTNGMISTDYTYRYNKNRSPDTAPEWLHDVVTDAFESVDTQVSRLRELKSQNFDGHLSDSMQSIFSDFSVPRGYREEITHRVINENADSIYDVMNVITDIASNDTEVAEDPELAARLMRVGGQIVAHQDYCDHCHRVM